MCSFNTPENTLSMCNFALFMCAVIVQYACVKMTHHKCATAAHYGMSFSGITFVYNQHTT